MRFAFVVPANGEVQYRSGGSDRKINMVRFYFEERRRYAVWGYRVVRSGNRRDIHPYSFYISKSDMPLSRIPKSDRQLLKSAAK